MKPIQNTDGIVMATIDQCQRPISGRTLDSTGNFAQEKPNRTGDLKVQKLGYYRQWMLGNLKIPANETGTQQKSYKF